jgi:predicted phosphohydrolase
MSLKAGRESGAGRILAFLHYPPLYADYRCDDILSLLEKYGADTCCFGHLHGHSHRRAITGIIGGIDYKLVSADYLSFAPIKII